MTTWNRQHEQQRLRIQEQIAQCATPFAQTGEPNRRARRALPLPDWCRTYLPHYFEAPSAPFHERMVDAVGEPGMPTFVGAFRGAGKSVLLALARPLWRTLSGQCPYFIFGSQVQKLAAQNMDYIRLELEHNPRIHADYGVPDVSGPQAQWEVQVRGVLGSAKFEAFGIGMSPRGRRHGRHRPLEFLGDDLEDAELARNPEREQNLWEWLMDEVIPALEPGRFVFTILGTMFGPHCMLQRARKLAEQRDAQGTPLGRAFVQPVVENGRSVWPERFDDDTLARIRATIGLRNWLRNYTLEPDDPNRPFQAKWMLTYEDAEVDIHALDVVVFLDPAVSMSARGCPRALIAVGADRRSGVRYVLDAWIERGTPTQMIEKMFDWNERLRPRAIGVEQNGGYALIRPLLAMHEEQRGQRLPTRYITHSRPKDLRIEKLCPQFETGRWRFPRNPNAGVRTLQEQFLSYPDGFVDGPDASAGCDELLPDAFTPKVKAGGGYQSLSRRTNFRSL
jgi:hypothetical protein